MLPFTPRRWTVQSDSRWVGRTTDPRFANRGSVRRAGLKYGVQGAESAAEGGRGVSP